MLRVWHKSIVKLAIIVMPIFVYLFLIAPQFVVLLYTDRYIESGILVRIHLCLYPIRVAQYPLMLNVSGVAAEVGRNRDQTTRIRLL